MLAFQWVQSRLTRRLSCDKGIMGGKKVQLMLLSGRIPEQRLVQK